MFDLTRWFKKLYEKVCNFLESPVGFFFQMGNISVYLIHARYYTAQELLMKKLTLGTSLSTNEGKTTHE